MIIRPVPPHDLAFHPTPDGVSFELTASRVEYVTEAARNRLNLWLREWFLDQREGVPYREAILSEKDPNLERVQRILEQVLESIPYVSGVAEFQANYDPLSRTMAPELRVILEGGEILEIDARLDRSFVIGGV